MQHLTGTFISLLLCYIILSKAAPVADESDIYEEHIDTDEDRIRCGGDCKARKKINEVLAETNKLLSQHFQRINHLQDDFKESRPFPEENDERLTLDQALEIQKEVKRQLHLSPKRVKRKITSSGQLWPNANIPFQIDTARFSASEEKSIRNAIAHIEANTVLTFTELSHKTNGYPVCRKKRLSDPNVPSGCLQQYLMITSDRRSCSSYLGMVGHKTEYPQTVSLASHKCLKLFGTPVHEILHAAGLIHEHQRGSRNGHIKVLTQNILPYYLYNYQQMKNVKDNLVPYDVASIMHYPEDMASKNNKPTLEPEKDKRLRSTLGQRNALSFLDAKAINIAYGPLQKSSDKCGYRKRCTNGGYQNPKQCSKCLCPGGLTHSCDFATPFTTKSNRICGGKFTLDKTNNEMTFKHGLDGSHYDFFDECTWYFQIAESGYHLEMIFQNEFRVLKNDANKVTCDSHFIEVKEDSNDFTKNGPRFCGYILPTEKLTSTGDKMLVHFRANDSQSFSLSQRMSKMKGFQFIIKAVKDGEQAVFSSEYGDTESPEEIQISDETDKDIGSMNSEEAGDTLNTDTEDSSDASDTQDEPASQETVESPHLPESGEATDGEDMLDPHGSEENKDQSEENEKDQEENPDGIVEILESAEEANITIQSDETADVDVTQDLGGSSNMQETNRDAPFVFTWSEPEFSRTYCHCGGKPYKSQHKLCNGKKCEGEYADYLIETLTAACGIDDEKKIFVGLVYKVKCPVCDEGYTLNEELNQCKIFEK